MAAINSTAGLHVLKLNVRAAKTAGISQIKSVFTSSSSERIAEQGESGIANTAPAPEQTKRQREHREKRNGDDQG